MRRTEVLQDVRMMKFRKVFGRCEEASLSKLEAAGLLGLRERTSRREINTVDPGSPGLCCAARPCLVQGPWRCSRNVGGLFRA